MLMQLPMVEVDRQVRARDYLLRVPLFYKILLANSAIVALGAVVGTVITVWHVTAFPETRHYDLIVVFGVAGLLVSFVVNAIVLRLALRPLDHLQSAVDMVRQGRTDVRVDAGRFGDERFQRLAATFNQMLDRLEQDARQLHQLSQAIIQAQEEERQRVARDLHDQAAQSLTSLLVRLRLLERAEHPAEAQRLVGELRQLTAQALEDVRRVALELRPTILDDLGLTAALSWRVDEFNAAAPPSARLAITGVDGRLPRPVELVCYRVVQEALTNIARHARAQHAWIRLEGTATLLTIEIGDDGVGFDSGTVHGLGLRGMSERLALVGGTLSIDTRPGAGTRLTAHVPLQSNERG